MTALGDRRCWILLGFVAFLFLTNAGIAAAPTGDAVDYRAIAIAAPGLPHEEIGSAYTGRFVVHYLVGELSSATGMPLGFAYGVALVAVLLTLSAVVYGLLRDRSTSEFAIAAALFALSPYALRPYLLQTTLLQDLVFVIGLGVCLLGLRQRLVVPVLAGLVVAVLGRQSAIAVAPVAAVWILADPAWRSATSRRPRTVAAAAAVLLTAGVYVAIKAFTAPFTGDYEPSVLRNSVLNRIGDLPGAATELAAHAARTAVPLIVPLAVIVTLVVCVGARRVGFRTWATLVVAASIVAQPLMIDPAWPGFAYNEQRLAALALLPLACAAGDLYAQWRRRPLAGNWLVLVLALLAVGSLHHEFSLVGPASLAVFLAVQVAVAVAVAALVTLNNRPPPPPAPPLLRGAGCRVYGDQT
ncbi:MAG: hypothetical protein ABW137_14250 [Mycobacterium sp.]